MILKWIKLVSVFGIFVLCFLFHFMYDWCPNTLFSIFFPVNESIFEHLKMMFTAMIFYGFFDFLILKFFHQKKDNFLVSLFLSSIMSIPTFLIIYLPFYYLMGENMILNLTCLFITVVISQVISYFVLKSSNFNKLNIVSLIGIILVYIIFGFLTYYPPINDLFFDVVSEKYGINTYAMW